MSFSPRVNATSFQDYLDHKGSIITFDSCINFNIAQLNWQLGDKLISELEDNQAKMFFSYLAMTLWCFNGKEIDWCLKINLKRACLRWLKDEGKKGICLRRLVKWIIAPLTTASFVCAFWFYSMDHSCNLSFYRINLTLVCRYSKKDVVLWALINSYFLRCVPLKDKIKIKKY